jgi:hypothetical protein
VLASLPERPHTRLDRQRYQRLDNMLACGRYWGCWCWRGGGWNVECAFLTRGPTIDIDTFPSFVTSTPILSKAAKHSTIASLIPHISFMRRLSISCNPSNPFIRYQYHYLRSRHTPLNVSKRSTNSSVN